jgi:uncharacterized coiled-coil protein SlyX
VSVALDPVSDCIQNVPLKQCAHCSAEYDDSVSFCTKDGKSLVTKSEIRTKLCPHCANSIAADTLKCPFCKAGLSPVSAPQWPIRDENAVENRVAPGKSKTSMGSTIILIVGLVVFAIGVFLIGGQQERRESSSLVEEKLRELRDKDLKIQTLEEQLARARKDLTENSTQLAELKTKLDESQKDLASAQQKLSQVREAGRGAVNRGQTAARTSPRSVETPLPPPASSAPARRAAEPGVYEAVRETSVYENPSASSRVVSQISKGTRVNVVRSAGEWLEVRSNRGNPPGFVRSDDAMFVSKGN